MEFHEGYWVTILTAAPVIVLALALCVAANTSGTAIWRKIAEPRTDRPVDRAGRGLERESGPGPGVRHQPGNGVPVSAGSSRGEGCGVREHMAALEIPVQSLYVPRLCSHPHAGERRSL